MDFAAVLERIGQHLDRHEQPFALVGGLGLAGYGIARATLDMDLLVPSEAQEGLVEMMESLGCETLYRSSGYSNHLHPDSDLA